MIRYIIKNDQGIYQYPRRETDSVYEQRTQYGPDVNQARLFMNKAAAQNSLNYHSNGWRKSTTPPEGLKIIKVEVSINELVEE